MSNKITFLLLIALMSSIIDRTFSMEGKRDYSEISNEDQDDDKIKEKPEKIRRIVNEVESGQDLADNGTLSALALEVQFQIVMDYAISAYLKEQAKIKSTYDIDKFITKLPLAQVNKTIRNLILDPIVKFLMIKSFVQDKPHEAINDLVKAAYNGDIEVVQNLIKAGADVNGIGTIYYYVRSIPISSASKWLKIEQVGTPLEFAVLWIDKERSQNNVNKPIIEIIRILLEAGAKPNRTASVNPLIPIPLLQVLTNRAINDDTRNKAVLTLLEGQANPNTRGYSSNEPALYYAIKNNYYNIIKSLLDYGANPWIDENYFEGAESDTLTNLIAKSDDTVKQIISNHQYDKLLFDSIKNKDYQTYVRLLAEPKWGKLPNFNINAQDNNGYTALMLATDCGIHELVWFLLANKANPNITANDGQTALIIAQEKGNEGMINLLKEYGAQ